MRITTGMITRNYLTSINFNVENIAKSQERIQSSRKFSNVWENVADASRALKVREQLTTIKQQKADASNAQGIVAAAESNLRSINDILISAREKALRGINGPMESVHTEVGKEIENLKEQILTFMNTTYAGKFLMGGVNNKEAPYQLKSGINMVDADGNDIMMDDVLTYNGIPVDVITKGTDGKYSYKYKEDATDPNNVKKIFLPPDTTDPDAKTGDIPYDRNIYVDLGAGFTVDETGEVDPRSAFNVAFNGLDILGFGTEVDPRTGKTVPNNIYNLMGKMVDMFSGKEPYDEALMDSMTDKLESVREVMFLNVTDLGNRDNYLSSTIDRLDNESTILTETRSKLEGVDDKAEAIRLSTYQYSWLATLKMGAKLLPQSLMDYIS